MRASPQRAAALRSSRCRSALTHSRTHALTHFTAFSDRDRFFRGIDGLLQRTVPGAAGQPHTTLRGAGHFIQEDAGEELGKVVAAWLAGRTGA